MLNYLKVGIFIILVLVLSVLVTYRGFLSMNIIAQTDDLIIREFNDQDLLR